MNLKWSFSCFEQISVSSVNLCLSTLMLMKQKLMPKYYVEIRGISYEVSWSSLAL